MSAQARPAGRAARGPNQRRANAKESSAIAVEASAETARAAKTVCPSSAEERAIAHGIPGGLRR
jgi:hypothetical protein